MKSNHFLFPYRCRDEGQPVSSFPDVNVPVRISDIVEMIQGVRSTRIMGRPVGARVTVEVVVLLQSNVTMGTNKIRAHGLTTWVPSGVKDELVGNGAVTLGCDVLYDTAF